MTDIPPTRNALLNLQEQRSLAEQGHSLLEKKRDALIHEFFSRIKDYKEAKQRTYNKLKEAYDDLHHAQATNGVDIVRSIGQSQPDQLSIEESTKNIMGVTVKTYHVQTNEQPPNASLLDADTTIEDAQQSFLHVAEDLIKLHEQEHIIHRLAEAITKTKRRVNSLEHIKIPAMADAEKHIEQRLEEQERQRFVTLKQLKG